MKERILLNLLFVVSVIGVIQWLFLNVNSLFHYTKSIQSNIVLDGDKKHHSVVRPFTPHFDSDGKETYSVVTRSGKYVLRNLPKNGGIMRIQSHMDNSNDNLDTFQHTPFQSVPIAPQAVQTVIHEKIQEDMREENDVRREEDEKEDEKEERAEERVEEKEEEKEERIEERTEEKKEERVEERTEERTEEKEERVEERTEEKEERVEERTEEKEEREEERGGEEKEERVEERTEEKEEEREDKQQPFRHQSIHSFSSQIQEREDKQQPFRHQSIHSFSSQTQEERTVEFSSGDGGFGNNILGLVSAYMIAALSNATFYLHYPTTIDSLFDITDIHGRPVHRTPSSTSWSRTRLKAENICFRNNTPLVRLLRNYPLPSVINGTHIIVSSNCPLFMWMLYNEDTYNMVVSLGLLPKEPFYKRDASLRGFDLLSKVLRTYFIPKQHIQDRVNELIKDFRGYTTVGFHIRKADRTSDVKESRRFLFHNDVSAFSTCEIFTTLHNPLIFVASDSTEAKQQVEKENPTRKVITSSIVAHHTYFAVRKEKSKHYLDDVLVDMLSLASCDYIIGTWKSTYSLLAAAFQGHIPYYVSRNSRCFIPKRIMF